jgi:hypothetical protein
LLFIHPHHPEVPYFGTLLFNAISFFLGLISFSGAIIFLYTTKNEIRAWFLGIPLIVAIAVVTISSLINPAVLTGLPVYGAEVIFSSINGIIALYLLAPFSALFFWSLKELRSDVKVLVLLPLGVSILFSGLIIEMLTMHDMIPYFLFYSLIGMPLIGVEFIATSAGLRKAPSDASSAQG